MKKKPALKWEPETWAEIDKRFPDAFTSLNQWQKMQDDVARFMLGNFDAQGVKSCDRRHVFDLPNNLRMICTLDETPFGTLKHISFGRGPKVKGMSWALLELIAKQTVQRWETRKPQHVFRGIHAVNFFY